ncbi:MAG: hypothetical protein ICV55_14105 [Coleofasciculus sp. C3-bin4]|nr:hypothetical protein [Coleofasciculus sp. C3-bin4]
MKNSAGWQQEAVSVSRVKYPGVANPRQIGYRSARQCNLLLALSCCKKAIAPRLVAALPS